MRMTDRASATVARSQSIFVSFEARRFSARALAASARLRSISSARSAVSARSVTRSGKTSANPRITANEIGWLEVAVRYFNSPMPNSVISGACPGNIPKAPSRPGTVASNTVSRSSCRSGVTTISSIASGSIFSLSGRLHFLGLLQHFFNRADHVKRLLRNFVVLSFHDFLEAAHGVFNLHVLAFEARELRRHEHRLRQEPLNAPRAPHGPLVFVREFFNTQNRDDVLQVFVALQH